MEDDSHCESPLGRFASLLTRFEVVSFNRNAGLVVLRTHSALSDKDKDFLDEGPFYIRSNSEDTADRKLLTVEVPRDRTACFVAHDLNDLMNNEGEFNDAPEDFLVLKIASGEGACWSGCGELPSEICSYRSILTLVSTLRKYSDAISMDQQTLSFFDVERVDIRLKPLPCIADSKFPSNRLIEFLETPGMRNLRIEAFKTTLWDQLKNYSVDERFERLVKCSRGDSFLNALRHNFNLSKSDYTLDRILEKARSEQRLLAEQVATMTLSLEAKAFVLPGTIFLAGSLLEPGKGITLQNVILLSASLALAMISTVAFQAQKDVSDDLKKQIESAQKQLSTKVDDKETDQRLEKLSGRLDRLWLFKLAIVAGAWLLFIVLAIVSFASGTPPQKSNDPVAQETAPVDASTSAVEPLPETMTEAAVGSPSVSEDEAAEKEPLTPDEL